jgi:hypothetical protein
MVARGRGAAIGVLALALCGCKGSHGNGADGTADRDAASVDVRVLIDAGPPPDDTIPPTSSDELTVRARHLLEALGKGDPALAGDIAFPRDGWLSLRDEADPGRDWSKHMDSPFQKSVQGIAKHHKDLDRAQFVSMDLGHAVVQSTPHHHGWKKPLWTVHGSRLTYTVDGHTRTVAIREMTAWRGAWYVTRLR